MDFPSSFISNALSLLLTPDLKSATSFVSPVPICVTSNAGPVPWLDISNCVPVSYTHLRAHET